MKTRLALNLVNHAGARVAALKHFTTCILKFFYALRTLTDVLMSRDAAQRLNLKNVVAKSTAPKLV